MSIFNKSPLGYSSKYEDLLVRISVSLIAAHTISSLRQKVGFFMTPTLPDYFPALATSFVISMAIFYVINRFNRYFDERRPWEPRYWCRLGLQIVFCMILPFVVAFGLTAARFAYFGYDIFEMAYFEFYVLPILLFELLINFYYNAAFIAGLTDRKNKNQTDVAKQKRQRDLKNMILQYDPVLFLCSQSLRSAKTISGEEIYWSFGLKDTMEALSSNEYFAISRNCIVKREAIDRLCPDPSNLQLKLKLKAPLKNKLEVSSRQVVDFNSWWLTKH